jgi:predicted RNA-binding protein with PUA-like domain
MKQYWLLKSEPEAYDFPRLRREGRTEWSGVRNYQARNFLRTMRMGDLGFFYHSGTSMPGIAGICRVVREAYPDFTAQDPSSEYYDPRACQENPIWMMTDVAYEADLPRFIPLAELREIPGLHEMRLLSRGSRLSIQPVTRAEWEAIIRMARKPPRQENAAAN